MDIKEAYGFIYITTNMINGKRYIGQRKLSNGWKGYLGSGHAFKQAIKKYGRENFHRDIIAIAYSKEELDKLEIEFIKLHNASYNRDYYNITFGGDGSKGFKHTKDAIEKISSKNTGQKRTIEQRKRISESLKGKKLSDEARKNISVSHKGYVMPDDQKRKIGQANRGKKYGETRSLEGKMHHDEAVKKKVICLTTGEIFNSEKEACVYYKIKTTISRCCKGQRKSAGKHPVTGKKLVWMYYEEYLQLQKIS